MRIIRSPIITNLSGKTGPYYFRKTKTTGLHLVARHDDPAPHKTTPWLLNKKIVSRLDARWRTMPKDLRLEWAICPPKKHMTGLGHFYSVNQRRMFMGFQGIETPVDTSIPPPRYGGLPIFYDGGPFWSFRGKNSLVEWDERLFQFWHDMDDPSKLHTCNPTFDGRYWMHSFWFYAPNTPLAPIFGTKPLYHIWMKDKGYYDHQRRWGNPIMCDPIPEPCLVGAPPPVPVRNVQVAGVDKHGNIFDPDSGPIDPPCPYRPSDCEPGPLCTDWVYAPFPPPVTSNLALDFTPLPPWCNPNINPGQVLGPTKEWGHYCFSHWWRGGSVPYDPNPYTLNLCCNCSDMPRSVLLSAYFVWASPFGAMDAEADDIRTLNIDEQNRIHGTCELTITNSFPGDCVGLKIQCTLSIP